MKLRKLTQEQIDKLFIDKACILYSCLYALSNEIYERLNLKDDPLIFDSIKGRLILELNVINADPPKKLLKGKKNDKRTKNTRKLANRTSLS